MKRSVHLVIAGLACSTIVVGLPAPSVTATASKKTNGDIVFVGSAFVGGWPLDSTPAGDEHDSTTEIYVDIYSTDLEGEAKRLTEVGPGRYAQGPAVSPDGKWIAYYRLSLDELLLENDWSDLMLMRVDGSDQQVLLHGPYVEVDPAWSPDGQKLAFVDLTHNALRVLDLRSRDLETVMSGRNEIRQPSWSPNGKAIAFEMEGGIYVVGSGGKNLRRITKKPRLVTADADWSPDGRWIAFTRDRASEPGPGGAPPDFQASDVWIASRDGSVERNLTDSGGTTLENAPSWSPDGRYISFVRGNGDKDNWSIWMMKTDGTGQREVFRFPDLYAVSHQTYWPDWAPASL